MNMASEILHPLTVFLPRMPLSPQTLPINTHHLKSEDLGRVVSAVYVEATCERYSYLSAPRRCFTWHIYLKLSGGVAASGAWDGVELRQSTTSVDTGSTISDNQECLLIASAPYPDYESPHSLEERRFTCTLAPADLLTVKDVVDLVSTKQFVPSSNKPSVWTEDVGMMRWCLYIVRALKESRLLAQVSEDKLMAEFESSKYRFELASGSTLVA